MMRLKLLKKQMSKEWIKIFEIKVDNKKVIGEVYFEGEYKIITTQKDNVLVKVEGTFPLAINKCESQN